MDIQELKEKARQKKALLEEKRIEDAVDYQIPDIGTLKLAPPMPREAQKLLLEMALRSPGLVNATESDAANVVLQTDSLYGDEYAIKLLMMCSIDPQLDEEAAELLLDSLTLSQRLDLITTCVDLSNQYIEVAETATEQAENFTETTDGSSNEQPQQ